MSVNKPECQGQGRESTQVKVVAAAVIIQVAGSYKYINRFLILYLVPIGQYRGSYISNVMM